LTTSAAMTGSLIIFASVHQCRERGNLAVLCEQGIRSTGAASRGWSEFGLITLRNTARRCETTSDILAGQAACAQVARRRATIYGSEGWGFESLRAPPSAPPVSAGHGPDASLSELALGLVWPCFGLTGLASRAVELVTALSAELIRTLIKAARAARRGPAPAPGLCLGRPGQARAGPAAARH